jgi:hypothetical protein
MSNTLDPAIKQNAPTNMSTPSDALARKFFRNAAQLCAAPVVVDSQPTADVYLVAPDTVDGKLRAEKVCIDAKQKMCEIATLLELHSNAERVVLTSLGLSCISGKKVWFDCFTTSSTGNPLNALLGPAGSVCGYAVVESDGPDTMERLDRALDDAARRRIREPSPSSSSVPAEDQQDAEDREAPVMVTVCLRDEEDEEDGATLPGKLERQPIEDDLNEPASPPHQRRKLPRRSCRKK